MPLSPCATNHELLTFVVSKLEALANLSTAQASARENGDTKLAEDLDLHLDLTHCEKERAVGAWQQHVREHGC